MKKSYFNAAATILCLASAVVADYSCQKDFTNSIQKNAGLQIFLTDDPSLTLDGVFVDIEKLEVKIEDDVIISGREGEPGDDHGSGGDGSDDGSNDDHNHGGWIALNVNAGIYNLMHLRNGIDTALASGNLPAGRIIKKFRLTLGNNNSVIWKGQTYPLVVKDNNNQVEIKLDDDNIFQTDGPVAIWFDFDAGRSIRMKDGSFQLRSSIRAFRKEKSAGIEGRISPAAAQPVIYAINGTDTSTARPGNEGEFTFIGLKPGNYNLYIDATANNYSDTLIQDIKVESQEDTHVGTITLHQ